MSPWRVLSIVWGVVVSCTLCGSGCGARTAIGVAEWAGGAGASASVSGSSSAQGSATSAAGAFAAGGVLSAGGGSAFDAGPGAGASFGGVSHGGAPADAGPGAAGSEALAGASGASGAGPEPGCDANAGLVLGPMGCIAVPPPRLIAPLSTSSVTSRQPSLRWLLAAGTDGAHVEVCADHACQTVLLSFDAVGSKAAPPLDLAPGALFWRAFGRSSGVTGKAQSATWELIVPRRSAATDTSWGTTLDVNGDGFADAVLGAPMVGSNQPSVPAGSGRAYLYLGSTAGLNGTPATSLTGPDGAKGRFGSAVSSAGDVNGDGYADVIVGAPGAAAYSGRAYVYLGGATGLASSPGYTLLGTLLAGAAFGTSVASAGDLNGDGYADVIVGAPLDNNAVGENRFGGRALVYFGSAAGTALTPSLTLSGSEPLGSSFGLTVGSAGDLNGDGFADLVVTGTPYITLPGGGLQGSPAFYVYSGAAAGPSSQPAVEIADQDWMFLAVAGGADLNGDGHADLVVGTMGSNSAAIYTGNDSTFQTTPGQYLGVQSGSGGYNYSFSRAGDLNGDGYQDLLAAFDQIFVYSGSPSGLVDAPVIFTPPVTAFAATIYGYRITQVSDFNRDGYDDIVVGERFDDNFVGRALVYMGGPAGLSLMPAVILPGMDGPGGELG